MIDCKPEGAVSAVLDAATRGLPPGVLVAGGSHGSLGIARSLGRRGVPVCVVANGSPLQKASRYVEKAWAWPANEPEAQVGRLLDLAEQYKMDGWALFAGGDEEVELLSRNRPVLSTRFRVTTPDWEVTRWAFDKRLTYQRCAELRIAHPWTRVLSDAQELRDLECPFPSILKPAYRRSRNAFTRAKAWLIKERSELLPLFEEASALVGPGVVLLQEMIPGAGESQFSFSALYRDGKPVATLVARRTRQFPIDFGYTSTFVETVDCPAIEEAADRFLYSIRYSGLAEVEFKFDKRDGSYKLLDVNPRVWTWHSLGQQAGIDFPYLMCLEAHGSPVSHARARTGARWILGARDFVAAVMEIRRGRLTLTAYLRSLRPPLEFGVFALDDPLPTFAAFREVVRRLWRERVD